jgi:hypothetical protein
MDAYSSQADSDCGAHLTGKGQLRSVLSLIEDSERPKATAWSF